MELLQGSECVGTIDYRGLSRALDFQGLEGFGLWFLSSGVWRSGI